MKRREFLYLVGLLEAAGLSSALPGILAAAQDEGLDYEEIRKRLQGRRLFVLPFSHVDWAWVNTRAWMIRRHATALAEVLDILQSTPDFRFFIENWNEQTEAFLQHKPERIGELRQAINQGKVAVCGGVANQHPGWFEQESLIRNMVMGRRLFRRLAPEANLEVMGHLDVTPGPSQMPQLLLKAGYRYYRLHRPDEGLDAQGLPVDFVWQGLDGSEILASRGFCCGFMTEESLPEDFADNWEAAVAAFYHNEIENRLRQPEGGSMVWIPFGCDDSRPLRLWHSVKKNGRWEEPRLPLPEFISLWNSKEAPPLSFATPVEYFHELEKERQELPRTSGVIDATMWTYWYGLNGNEALRVWRTRTDQVLVAAEGVCCLTHTLGENYPERQLERLWRLLLGVYSHAQNWLFRKDYEQKRKQVESTLYAAEAIRDRATEEITSRIKLDGSRSSVVLFNDLPWERTEIVEIRPEFQNDHTPNIEVKDSGGRRIPFQVLDANWWRHSESPAVFRDTRMLVRASVPALGYTTVYVDPVPGSLSIPESETSVSRLETGSATIQLSSRGIDFIEDQETGARYTGAGNVIYNEIEDTGPYHYGPVRKTFQLEDAKIVQIIAGKLRNSFVLQGTLGPHGLRITGHYYSDSRRLAFETEIESRGGSGHFMTTVGLPAPGELEVDVHFGVEERKVSAIAYQGQERRRENVFYGAHWAHYRQRQSGLTLMATTGEKGFQFFPDSNTLGHFLLMTIPPAPLDNWERFVTPAREGKGRHRFDYQILLHSAHEPRSRVVRRALEARTPIRAIHPSRRKPSAQQELPGRRSFLALEPETVQISAFYRAQEHYLLRVFESAGESARVSVTLPFAVSSAEEVDFNGSPLGKRVEVARDKVSFRIEPWEIVTLSLASQL